MPTLYQGLTAIDIDTKNFVRVHKNINVQMNDVVTLANGRKYKIVSFTDMGFAKVKRV